MISDEAVEAAAKAVPAGASIEKDDLHSILEAAAPHMLADAWDEASGFVRSDTQIDQRIYVANRIKQNNPYRSQA